MARKSYLANTSKEKRTIGGIGDFGHGFEPIEVSADIAHQYDTKEAKDDGWMVTHRDDPVVAPAPQPLPPPASAPAVASVPKPAEAPKAEVKK